MNSLSLGADYSDDDGDTNILGKYLSGDGRTSCSESPIKVIVVNT